MRERGRGQEPKRKNVRKRNGRKSEEELAIGGGVWERENGADKKVWEREKQWERRLKRDRMDE